MPIFKQAKELFKHEFPDFILEDVQCDDPSKSSICQENNIQGYPTVKIVNPDGTIKDYNNPRSVEGLRKAIKDMSSQTTGSTSLPIGQLISRLQFTAGLENSQYHNRLSLLAIPHRFNHHQKLDFL